MVGKVNYSQYRCEVNLVFRTSGLIRICLIRHMAKFGNSKPISGLYILHFKLCSDVVKANRFQAISHTIHLLKLMENVCYFSVH